jgi:alpha-beta hydrolase superfamily lysophospholipase
LGEADRKYTIESYTAADGCPLRYRHYPTTGQARARVVCIHGIQSHAGWYDYSCGRLAEAGFELFFLDRRGSGLNTEARGDMPSFRRLLDDIAEFICPLPRPVILVAISWGGRLGVALQRRHPGLVDGLALLCPGLCPKVGAPFMKRCVIAAWRLVSPRKLFPIPLNEPELFTATPRWQQFIRDDPLSLHAATARFMVQNVRLGAYLRLFAREVRAPVLLTLAGSDRIIDNGRTRRFLEKLRAPQKTVVEYPGAHHTLEFEPEPARFVNDLIDWLQTTASLAKTRPSP